MLRHILLIDNFDSFTYNLVDFFRQLGCTVKVFRNTTDPAVLVQENFDLLVLSPGPSVPKNAGNLLAIIAQFYQSKPILGVCLGHQALIEFFGGSLANIAPVHGKSVPLIHDGRGIFSGLEPNCLVARYHSWAADALPAEMEVSASAQDGTVMGIRHKSLPIEGIQFHPESVLSMKNNAGMRMLQNVLDGRLSAGNRIFHQFSRQLQQNISLKTQDFNAFLKAVEEGQLSEDQKQILLVSLSYQLRNPESLATFMEAMLQHSPLSQQKIAAHFQGQPKIGQAIDLCGTGGSGLPRINTSTLASLLLAHLGLPIVKHGNRAAAGRFGSFNLLEALGIPCQFNLEIATETLKETDLAFLFAPDIHPVFKHFAATRSKIGVPTVFNILGPLLNPFQPKRQLIGTAFPQLMEVIFETGIRMGKEHLIVVCSEDGLDEISLSSPTKVLEFYQGERSAYTLYPSDFDLEPIPFEQLSAANAESCIQIAQDMIDGVPNTPHHRLVAANAAFIYTKFMKKMPLPDALRLMEEQIHSGALNTILQEYKSILEPQPILT
jgi:anthranilate synthase/phosphoribosyltransferase